MANFKWHAVLKDGTQIDQIDQHGCEHLFQEVRDNFKQLVLFFITDTNGIKLTIDLIKGTLIIGNAQSRIEELKEIKENIRLIYFRRNKVTLSIGNDIQNHTVVQCVGFQYIDKLGNNRKIMAQIDEAGNILIGE